MKNCPEVEELLFTLVGDGVIGFFERKLVTSNQEMRVFIPVYQSIKPKDFVN